jgi:O-antigen/teichoic acid export membrane protein
MNIITKLLPSVILDFFSKGQTRSIEAKKNILGSFFAKAISICVSLILVPLTINYVNPSQYGIWITISSIVGWFSFFDIGLTQGLRNKFAEARAKGDDNLASIYISTTFALLGLICFTIWLIFSIIIPFLNWSKITNSPQELSFDITALALIVFSYFCLQFVFRIITTVLIADQKPAKASFIDVLGQLISLLSVIVLRIMTKGSLINLGLALCLSPLIVLILSHFIFFNGTYKKYKPKLNKVNFKHIKSLFNIGVIFLVIQIAGIIQFETASIIIAQNFSTLEVTSYNIVYKYFGILNMGFNIFLTPFWSATTDAFIKNDINWIKNGIKKYNYLNIILVLLGLLMLVFSNIIYDLWIGKENILIDFNLSLWGYLFFVVSMFGSKYCSFLNGISALRIQFISSIISPFLYIASALLLIKIFNLGTYALFIASIIANFNGFVLAPIQYHMIINKNKKGIWIK